MTYSEAIRALNSAAYAALRSAYRDNVEHPMADLKSLHEIANMTDQLVDADAMAAAVSK